MIGRLADSNPRILGYIRAAEQAAEQGAHLTGSLLAFARRQSLSVERVNSNSLLQILSDRRFGRSTTGSGCGCPLPRACLTAWLTLCIFMPRSSTWASTPDAMPEGGQLSIATGETTLMAEDLLANPDASPGRFLSVAVQDEGSGMTADVLARVSSRSSPQRRSARKVGLACRRSTVLTPVRRPPAPGQSTGRVHE